MSEPETPCDLVLEGLGGWVQGESYAIAQGEVTIGRSRSCDISLRRCAGYRAQDPSKRDQDHDFNTVSRVHLRIKVAGEDVTISDLSSNGTYCDDHPIDGSKVLDMSQTSALVLRLGTRESLVLRRSDASRSHLLADRDQDSQDGCSTNRTESNSAKPADANESPQA